MAGIQDGVAGLVSALTGGGAIQQRAKSAEEMRLLQVQQERADVDKRISDAITAAAQAKGFQDIQARTDLPNRDFILAGRGSDFKAATEAEGVQTQNLARDLAMVEARKAAPGPDLQNAFIGIAGDKLLAPSNVMVEDQAQSALDVALANEQQSRAAAGASNSTAALNNAKLPFVDDLAQGEVDLNAAQLVKELALGQKTQGEVATAGLSKLKTNAAASSALRALDQLDAMDNAGVGGPIAGRITPAFAGEAGQKIEEYNSVSAGLVADLQRLQRIPGIGAQSDRELAELIKAAQSADKNPETRKTISANTRAKLQEMFAVDPALSSGADAGNADPEEGMIADSPDGGPSLIKRNGRWVPL